MSESVSLPALGESVTEGTVTRWLKQVGDHVEVDEPLLEVSTDKVDTEIPSPVAGIVEEILVAEDETVEVGAPLVRIGDGSGGGSAPADESSAAPAAEVPAAGTPTEAPIQSSAPEQSAPAEQQPAEKQPAQDQPAEQQPAQNQSAPDQQAYAAPQEQAPAQQPAAQEPAEQPEDLGAGTAAAAEVEAAEVQEEAPETAHAEPVQAQPTQDQPAHDQPAQAAPAPASTAPQAPAPAPAADADDTSHAGYVTPIVRKLAHEKNVDLSGLTGTGVGGRIRKQDVLDAAERAASAAQPAADVAPATAPTAARTAPAVSELRGTTVPMSRLRKVVAERAVVSMQTSAQLTTVVEVDVTNVARYRDRVKGEFQEKTGTKLSFLPFFTLAAAEALKTYPIVNATIEGESIVYPDHENISIAVDTERGLLTPVVRNASELSIADLAKEIADLAARTRDNRLKPDELSGGTFTVTNTGSRGALFDTPLVFLPQVAILGTGVVVKKPVVISQDGSDAIAIRSTVYLALSYDHRIVDGADAARFLTAVKDRLEAGDFAADLGL